jgi:hypothetical protein
VVDDFGVQYVGEEHAHHLITALETDYTVSKDWMGGLYCGITLHWDYVDKYVDLSMPGYIKDALHKFQHPLPKRPEYAPHNWTLPAYGQRVQYAPPPDIVKLLPLPQPPVRARTDARTNPSAQRATQLRSVLARVYAVSIQNQITTTVP